MKLDWYKNSYRRNLVDMHIEDWNEEFLSKLSAEEYCENLKRGKFQSAMIYLQNHNGQCYFPTEVGHTHRRFQEGENEIRRLVNLCHENQIDVIGYYSLIYNTYEEDRHKDWRLYGSDGMSQRERGGRYGHLCPNNPEYREFLKVQIKELLDYFDVDGMFYDMTFWPQFCDCKYCRDRFEKETGRKKMVFDGDIKNPEFHLHRRKRAEWMGEFAKFVTEYTKKLRPGMTVEHNYASSIAGGNYSCSTELVNDWCDYTGGDLYGDLYGHSFTAKYYRTVTQKQPYEYMTCRCDRRLYQHTITKSEQHLETEVMLNVANHAATLIIDAIDPRGTMDSRVYDRMGKIFSKEKQYESHMHGKPVCDLGILYFTLSFKNTTYEVDGQNFDNRSASVLAAKILIKDNVQFNVLPGNRAALEGYKCIIAPAVSGVDEQMIDRIVQYVENGGTFYFSGVEEPRLLSRLLDAEFVEMNDYAANYIAPKTEVQEMFGEFNADYPLPIEYPMPIVKTGHPEDILAYITYPYTNPSERRFASIHSNPPGVATDIPAVLARSVGKGKVIWSAVPIENDTRAAFEEVFSNIIESLLPKRQRSLLSTAPKRVELVTYVLGEKLQINAVDLLAMEEALKLPAFKIWVKWDKEPRKLVNVTSGEEVSFTCENGYVTFVVDGLTVFDMYELE